MDFNQDKNQAQNQYKEYEIPIGDSFKLDARRKLGKGQFFEVFYGLDKKSNEEVAIKLELSSSKYLQLLYESRVYQILEGEIGIPRFFWYGKQGNYNILIMELLGHSLEDIFTYCKRKFSLLTILMIIEQVIYRIEYIHNKNFIHRNLSPDNILIGRKNNKSFLYLIDFIFAKRYYNPKTGEHIPFKEGKTMLGNARFASINTHLGIEQSRRDDIEALGYMMVYLMKGFLPWQGMVNSNPKKKYDRIKKLKMEIQLPVLCSGLPKETIKFIQYARDMKFEDKPNYNYLRSLLKRMATKMNEKMDSSKFDWIVNEKNGENK
jgi:casein kinase 1